MVRYIALLITAIMYSCTAIAGPQQSEAALVQKFIISQYRPDGAETLWRRDGEEKPFSICHQGAFKSVAGEQPRLLLAMCTNDPADTGFGIVPTTVIDFYLLEIPTDGGELHMVTKQTLENTGYSPEADDFTNNEIVAVRPGEGLYGFWILTGYVGHGDTLQQASLFVYQERGFIQETQFFYESNNGMTQECNDDENQCTRLERKFRFDSQHRGEDRRYPIVVDETCTRGKQEKPAHYQLEYRRELKAYQLPDDDWPQGHCAAD